jgi:hypothetical protein
MDETLSHPRGEPVSDLVLVAWIVAGLIAALMVSGASSTLTRAMLAMGAILAIGGWIPLLGLAAFAYLFETDLGGNAVGLGILAWFATNLGGIIAAVGLYLRTREWAAARDKSAS